LQLITYQFSDSGKNQSTARSHDMKYRLTGKLVYGVVMQTDCRVHQLQLCAIHVVEERYSVMNVVVRFLKQLWKKMMN